MNIYPATFRHPFPSMQAYMRRTEAVVGMAPLESLKVRVLQSRTSAS
ncbi:MAG: hypothetical protein KGZ68_04270 [Dechloromonas sp.]|nr:hypothetical protein [Dechloromonas sp.]